jgi:hypothetical protein
LAQVVLVVQVTEQMEQTVLILYFLPLHQQAEEAVALRAVIMVALAVQAVVVDFMKLSEVLVLLIKATQVDLTLVLLQMLLSFVLVVEAVLVQLAEEQQQVLELVERVLPLLFLAHQ